MARTSTSATGPRSASRPRPAALRRSGASAPTYTLPVEVFADRFQRPTGAVGQVGNGWLDPTGAWRVLSPGVLRSTAGGPYTNPLSLDLAGLVSPATSMAAGDNYSLDVRIKSNGVTSPVFWRGAVSNPAVGLFLYGGSHVGTGSTLPSNWQGAGSPGVMTANPSYTGPACEASGAFWTARVFYCGDITALAAYDPAAPLLPYMVGGSDTRAYLFNSGGDYQAEPNYSSAYYAPSAGMAAFVSNCDQATAVVTAQTPHTVVFCWGDSITCYGWPTTLQACLGLGYRIINLGGPGLTLATLHTNFPGTASLSAISAKVAAARAAGKRVWVVVSGGTNDMAANATGSGAYALLQTCIADMRGAGAERVWAWQVLPRTAGFTAGQTAGGFVTARTAYNAAVVSGATTATSGYAAADPAAFDAGMLDSTDTVRYGDQVHPTSFGMYQIGRAMTAALA